MKIIILLMFSLSLLVNCGGGKDTQIKTDKSHEGHTHSNGPADKMTAGENLVYYTCPMDAHSAEYSSDPGHCPICNMDLAAGVITEDENRDFFGCPMLIHSHIRAEKPGTCVDCGMNLKPMRLIK
jgi:hypothetical protein